MILGALYDYKKLQVASGDGKNGWKMIELNGLVNRQIMENHKNEYNEWGMFCCHV